VRRRPAQTLATFLRSCEPLYQSAAEAQLTRHAVDEALRPDSFMRTLHRRLLEHDRRLALQAHQPSWLQQYVVFANLSRSLAIDLPGCHRVGSFICPPTHSASKVVARECVHALGRPNRHQQQLAGADRRASGVARALGLGGLLDGRGGSLALAAPVDQAIRAAGLAHNLTCQYLVLKRYGLHCCGTRIRACKVQR